MPCFKKSRTVRFTASLLLAAFVLGGNAAAESAGLAGVDAVLQIYQDAPDNPSLQRFSQFHVVDDFNNGKFTVREGAAWRVKEPAIGAIDLSIDRKDGRSLSRGHSMKAVFNLSPREKASFETFLGRIDVSRAEYFVFKAKLEQNESGPLQGRLLMTLRDWRHRLVTHDITPYFSHSRNGWETVLLPLALFEELDPDQLISLRFTLASGDRPLRGQMWLDELAFWGGENMLFESHRDNMAGFPGTVYDNKRREELRKIKNDKKFLRAIAADTWKYFENAWETRTYLIADHIRTGNAPLIADYTSPTNIAMDLMGTVAAMDLGFISRAQAVERTGNILATLKRLPKYKGFFYNFYDIKKLAITRRYISSVDSGWLAIALVVTRQAFPQEFGEDATRILDGFDFGEFLDPENNHLVVGFDVPVRNFGSYHYGLFVTEARATSFYAIGKGDVPRGHWWFLYRTLPKVWSWQRQVPRGRYVSREGVEYFQGYYEKNGKKFVPSWGGSLFEVLMPTLVIKERELAPKGLGLNNRIVTELHRDYCLKEKNYPVWGLSPCSISSGRNWAYREYGATDLGAKGYPDQGIVTPHVAFLALDSLPKDAIANIRRLLDYEIIGEYGFYDSVNVRNGHVNPQYLALDQGMILVAIANFLTKGAIQERFHADPVGKKAESLLSIESFFNE